MTVHKPCGTNENSFAYRCALGAGSECPAKTYGYIIGLGKCGICSEEENQQNSKTKSNHRCSLRIRFTPARSHQSPQRRLSAGGLLPLWNVPAARSCRFFRTPHSSAQILPCSSKIPWSSLLFPNCCQRPAKLR